MGKCIIGKTSYSYKAEKIGKRVIEISEKNTSKRCYVCGKMHDISLWQRTMKCDCGNNIDRDRNSAINIMIDFLSIMRSAKADCISQYGPWTAYQKFVDNLRQTGLLVPNWTML